MDVVDAIDQVTRAPYVPDGINAQVRSAWVAASDYASIQALCLQQRGASDEVVLRVLSPFLVSEAER